MWTGTNNKQRQKILGLFVLVGFLGLAMWAQARIDREQAIKVMEQQMVDEQVKQCEHDSLAGIVPSVSACRFVRK